MASIIQPTDFYGDLSLALVGQTSVQVDIQKYIDKFEPEYLNKVLGLETFKKLATLPDIKAGKEYHSRFDPIVLTKWRGLIMVEGSSPLASYIYCRYMQDQYSRTTGTGEKKLKAANASSADSSYKIIKQWDLMVDYTRQLIDFMLSDQVTYSEFYNYFNSMWWVDNGFEFTVSTHGVF